VNAWVAATKKKAYVTQNAVASTHYVFVVNTKGAVKTKILNAQHTRKKKNG